MPIEPRSKVSVHTPHSGAVERIVTAVGSYSKTGELLGIGPWQVKKWMLTDEVPEHFLYLLRDIAKRYGLDVHSHDLHTDVGVTKI